MNFFIRNPYPAMVLALIIVLCGVLGLMFLPVAQYPDVTPPQVTVTAVYPGADAATLLETVAEPLEQRINGVRDLIYISSKSSNSGTLVVTVTFRTGSSGEANTKNVQDRVDQALSSLPQAVQREGVVVQETSGNILLAIGLYSPDCRFDSLFLANYANIHLENILQRIPGVAQVTVFGGGDYAMRVWLDSNRMAQLKMTYAEIVSALNGQNVQVSSGSSGSAPGNGHVGLSLNMRTRGRLKTVEEFRKIIVRANSDGSQVLLGDVSRIELGSENYANSAKVDRFPAAILMVFQRAGANGIDVSNACRKAMKEASGKFPAGIRCGFQYDSTDFVRISIREVVWTLGATVLLVAFVTFLFLQNWRMTLVPVLAIPVSIAGTFAFLPLLGFSINLITLFAMILAIGIVVDDAIIVIENVERLMNDEKLSPVSAAEKSVSQIAGAVFATTAVLLAMFIPICFLSGISGEIYRQFGVTISIAVVISAVNALTLSPALSALILKKSDSAVESRIDRIFNRVRFRYGKTLGSFMRHIGLILFLYALFAAGAVFLYGKIPSGFIPEEDQGYFFVNLRMLSGSSLSSTTSAAGRAAEGLMNLKGVKHVIYSPGFDLLTNTPSPDNAFLAVTLEDWTRRKAFHATADAVIQESRGVLMERVPNSFPMVFAPPPVPGIGTAGGFHFVIRKRSGNEIGPLAGTLGEMMMKCSRSPFFQNLFTTFQENCPYVFLRIDWPKVTSMGIAPADVNTVLENSFGYQYINQLNRFGRVCKLETQSMAEFRDFPEKVWNLHVKSSRGGMAPFSSFTTLEYGTGPEFLSRYNLCLSAQIQGTPAPGVSSGEAMEQMERIAASTLPPGMDFSWTEMSYQELHERGALLIFILALTFIFLFLSALYGSWLLPFSVILSIFAALGIAVLPLHILGMDNNIYTKAGVVLLFGMACKTAILIVNFARREHRRGTGVVRAALTASGMRFRAVLMTSFAFIFGTLPLAFSSGPGSLARNSIGVAVSAGMLGAVLGSILIVPLLYIVIQRGLEWKFGKKVLIFLVGLLFLCGCYTPPKGTEIVGERSFSHPQMRGKQELLENLKILTLDDAVRIALANNPSYRSAAYSVTTARMLYYQALGAYSPNLTGSFYMADQLYSESGSGASNLGMARNTFFTNTSLQATLLVFDGLAREFSLLAAKKSIRIEERIRENAERLLIRAVGYAYTDLQLAMAKRSSAEADVRFQSEEYRIASAKFRSGSVPESSVLNFQGELARAEISLVRAKNQYELGLFALAVLMGYHTGALPRDLIPVPGDGRDFPPLLSVDSYLDLALSGRPDLNAWRDKLEIMKYEYYRTYSAFSPNFHAFAGYSYASESAVGGMGYFPGGNYFSYGGYAFWNFFEGFIRYNKIRAEKSRLDQAYWQGVDRVLSVIQDVRSAYSNLIHSREIMTIAARRRDVFLKQRNLVAREYNAGESDITRLNYAQDSYVKSENDWSEAVVNTRKAVIQLNAAVNSK